jgi:hypothetical protein
MRTRRRVATFPEALLNDQGGTMTKRDLVAAAAGALAASALAGGVAWAAIPDSDGVIQGCYNSGGNLKVVPELPCPKGWTSLPWNQQGPKGVPGADGVSPSVTQLSPGDVHCPDGGAALTDAAGSTAYVCNGAAGADGQPFAGTFRSPNGEYSISVTDAGITLRHGTSNSIVLAGDNLTVHSGDIAVRSDGSTDVKVGATATLDSAGNIDVRSGGSTDVKVEGTATLDSVGNIDVRSGGNTSMQVGGTATMDSSGNLSLITDGTGLFHAAGPLNLQGSVVNVN